MVIKDGKLPSMRASHAWTSKFSGGILNKIGIGSTSIRFRCGGNYHDIKIKGVHVDKKQHSIEMDNARLMRQAGDNFFFLVDLSTHGVNKSARKRGGYMLCTFTRANNNANKWIQEEYYYSKEETKPFGIHNVGIAHKAWRIVRYCYYGLAVMEDTGGDNSG